MVRYMPKILSNRIQTVIPEIINKDQVGFIKGRYIGENLLDLLAVIDYCKFENIPAMIVSLDIEKSFRQDRLGDNVQTVGIF